MPYDGNGVFLPLPTPTYPAVPGQVIYAEYFNLNVDNLIAGLTAALPRDGQSAMTGELRMGGYGVKDMGAGSVAGDAVEWGQWQNSFYAPSFTAPTTESPTTLSDDKHIPNTAWVRMLVASAAAINLPSIVGKVGQLNTDGTTVFWQPGIPDYILNASGVF